MSELNPGVAPPRDRTPTGEKMKYLLFIRSAMLLALIGFFLFWYLPSMRGLLAYREAMDRVFNKSESCWQRKYNAGEYKAANSCFDEWYRWESQNTQPDLGVNWPWATWRETPDAK